ncbi:MAG: pentapeptide repeat-containing protein [Planctomycetota bacterium]
MNPDFPIEPPDLQPDLAACRLRSDSTTTSFGGGDVIERASISGNAGHPLSSRGVRVFESRITGGVFAGSTLPGLRLTDCAIEHADLASATWTDAGLTRVACSDCRLSGFDARGASLRDVCFRSCRAPDMFLTECRLMRVRFEQCELTGLDLTGAHIDSLAVRGCDARSLRVIGARIGLLDLRSSRVEGLMIDAMAIAGIVIDPLQAPAFAMSLGARVLDPD